MMRHRREIDRRALEAVPGGPARPAADLRSGKKERRIYTGARPRRAHVSTEERYRSGRGGCKTLRPELSTDSSRRFLTPTRPTARISQGGSAGVFESRPDLRVTGLRSTTRRLEGPSAFAAAPTVSEECKTALTLLCPPASSRSRARRSRRRARRGTTIEELPMVVAETTAEIGDDLSRLVQYPTSRTART